MYIYTHTSHKYNHTLCSCTCVYSCVLWTCGRNNLRRLQTFPITTREWAHYSKVNLHSNRAKLGTLISLRRTRAELHAQPRAPGLDMLFFSPRRNAELRMTKYSQYTRDFVLFSSSPVTQEKLRNQMSVIEHSFPAYWCCLALGHICKSSLYIIKSVTWCGQPDSRMALVKHRGYSLWNTRGSFSTNAFPASDKSDILLHWISVRMVQQFVDGVAQR